MKDTGIHFQARVERVGDFFQISTIASTKDGNVSCQSMLDASRDPSHIRILVRREIEKSCHRILSKSLFDSFSDFDLEGPVQWKMNPNTSGQST